MLTRSFMTPETNKDLLAYTPMFHARMFAEGSKYRTEHFQPTRGTLASPPDPYHTSQISDSDWYLDGHKTLDRPLFVQFCANNPDELLAAAKIVQPFCDAVDLNLGCPQGIARKGNYGAFLQEDWDTIYKLINTLHKELDIPVTAKMRILDSREKTLEYAKTILSAGASILTVHGRQRDQKGHNTGVADWKMLRFLRDNLPPDTVMFANGNILQHEDIAQCMEETGVDGVMSAEGNLYDPSIFGKPPPVGQEGREYWRGRDGKGGYRMDAALRRYMDIIHRHVLDQEPPQRKPLFLPSDPIEEPEVVEKEQDDEDREDGPPPKKKQKRKEDRAKGQREKCTSPNLTVMQPHLFHMLRPLVSKHTHVRDALGRVRAGDIEEFERILSLVEEATKEGLLEYEKNGGASFQTDQEKAKQEDGRDPESLATIARCKRPWFICQPYIRPLPKEALAKGALMLSKKEKARLEREKEEAVKSGVTPEGHVEEHKEVSNGKSKVAEIPKEGMVCG